MMGSIEIGQLAMQPLDEQLNPSPAHRHPKLSNAQTTRSIAQLNP